MLLAATLVLVVGDIMLEAQTEDIAEVATTEARDTDCFAARGRSHWLSTRMSAKAMPLFQPVPIEDLPTPVETAEEIVAVEAAEPADEPVTSNSDHDNAVPTAVAAEDTDSTPPEPSAAAREPRRFGAEALFASALAGAATALVAILTFGISHGRWEHAIDFQAYAEVIEPRTAELETSPIRFAEAAITSEPAETEIPGVAATRPVNFPVAGDDIEGPSESVVKDKEEVTDFSSSILGTPFVSGDTDVAGTAVASASPVLAGPDSPAAGDVPSNDETVAQAASFDSYQVAGVFEASDSPSAGAVLSDGSDVIGASFVPASGKIVVDHISSSMGEKAVDAETTVVSIPAGTKKVDAVLHVVTADGRLAQISNLSVVVGDKIGAAPDRPVRKSAQRKTSAPAVKDDNAAKLANRKSYRPQVSPPAVPPRGLFNFGSMFGLKKDRSLDGYKGGAAG